VDPYRQCVEVFAPGVAPVAENTKLVHVPVRWRVSCWMRRVSGVVLRFEGSGGVFRGYPVRYPAWVLIRFSFDLADP
jgi:hypothetical protein